MNDLRAPVVRRIGRALALAPAVLLTLVAAPALATAPEQWETAEPVSGLSVLVLLVAIPAGLILLITLLVYVPSMARGSRQASSDAWRHESEWFGGPSAGVDAAGELAAPESEAGRRGGSSGRW